MSKCFPLVVDRAHSGRLSHVRKKVCNHKVVPLFEIAVINMKVEGIRIPLSNLYLLFCELVLDIDMN